MSHWSPRWVPAIAVTAVSLAALAAVTFGVREHEAAVPAAVVRPAADARVDVVRAPASAVPAGEPACRTCTLGAAKRWL